MFQIPRIVSIALLVLVLGLSAFAASDVTTGQFLIAVAKAKGLAATDAATAVDALRAAGYKVPRVALEQPLTEGAVTAVAVAIGLPVTTKSPDAPFASSQVDAFLAAFDEQIGARRGRNSTQDSDSSGVDPETKGKKKGHHKSSSEPTDSDHHDSDSEED
jgi:hypothetical protein